MLAESRTFTRYNSTDETLEFSTPGPNAATLAYIDHNADGTADVVVFNPYKGTRRHYDGRNPVRALAIVRRHLASEGYEMPALEAPAADEAPADDPALLQLAETLNTARLQANTIEAAAPQDGVYGATAGALIDVLALIAGGYAAGRAYGALLDCCSVTEALAYGRRMEAENAAQEAAEAAAAVAGTDISAYDVKRGDKFTYCGTEYEAVADATGEFNAYCRVWNARRREVTEILMRHGSIVTLLERSAKWEVLGNGEAHGAYATRGAAQAMADRMNEASDVRDGAGRIVPVFHVAPQQA